MHDTVGKADREKEPGERLARLEKRMTANIESTNRAYNMVASVRMRVRGDMRKILVAPPDQKDAKMEAVAPPEPGALNVIEDMVSNQSQRLDALLHELDLLGKDLS